MRSRGGRSRWSRDGRTIADSGRPSRPSARPGARSTARRRPAREGRARDREDERTVRARRSQGARRQWPAWGGSARPVARLVVPHPCRRSPEERSSSLHTVAPDDARANPRSDYQSATVRYQNPLCVSGRVLKSAGFARGFRRRNERLDDGRGGFRACEHDKAAAEHLVRAHRRPRPRRASLHAEHASVVCRRRCNIRQLLREQLVVLPVARHDPAWTVRPQHRRVVERRRERWLRARLHARRRAGHRGDAPQPVGLPDCTRRQVPERVSERGRPDLPAPGLGHVHQSCVGQSVQRVPLRAQRQWQARASRGTQPRLRDPRVHA